MFTHNQVGKLSKIGNYDLAVVVGGMAGVAAACAAARAATDFQYEF